MCTNFTQNDGRLLHFCNQHKWQTWVDIDSLLSHATRYTHGLRMWLNMLRRRTATSTACQVWRLQASHRTYSIQYTTTGLATAAATGMLFTAYSPGAAAPGYCCWKETSMFLSSRAAIGLGRHQSIKSPSNDVASSQDVSIILLLLLPFYGPLSGPTQVSQYQKKHSPMLIQCSSYPHRVSVGKVSH